jgi:hypothetical protein
MFEHEGEYAVKVAAISSSVEKISCNYPENSNTIGGE